MGDALDLFYGLVLEDGRRLGEAATGFQREDAEAVLGNVCPNHFLTRPRGDSKTGDLAAMNIAVALTQAPPRARLFSLASDERQGRLLLDAISAFSQRTPELAGALTLYESRVVFPRADVRLDVLAADQASIWGLRPWFTTVDEIAQWHTTTPPQRCFEAVSTASVKVPGSRLVVLTTAGEPGHWSRAVLDRALADPALWRVNQVPGPSHWLDPERLEGERRRLPESSWRRLFLNEWAASEDRLADDSDLEACIDDEAAHETPRSGVRYVLGVDIGVKNDRTAVVVAHAEKIAGAEFPRVVVDRLQTWTPSRLRPVKLSTVEQWVEEYARRYRAPVRFDPSQALHMMQRLKRAGLRCEEFTFSGSSVGKLAVTLLTLVRERALALPDNELLLTELRNVRIRESSPGTYRLDHAAGAHDDQAIALALAASWLVDRPAQSHGRTISPFPRRGRQPAPRRTGLLPVAGSGGVARDPFSGAVRSETLDVTGVPAYSRQDIAEAERRALGRRR